MAIDYAKDALFMVRDAGEVCLKGETEFHAVIEDYEDYDEHTEKFIGMALMLATATMELEHRNGDVVTVRGTDYTVRDLRDDGKGLARFKLSREVER